MTGDFYKTWCAEIVAQANEKRTFGDSMKQCKAYLQDMAKQGARVNQKPVAEVERDLLAMFTQKPIKHGVEPRYSKGRKLKLLSYAVWVNGVCQVDHKTTAAGRKVGDIQARMNIELSREGMVVI